LVVFGVSSDAMFEGEMTLGMHLYWRCWHLWLENAKTAEMNL
jgi:hypothetical protein